MGNCSTAETSTAEFSVILYDEVTRKEYRVKVENHKETVWSTVNEECKKRESQEDYVKVRRITFGGTDIFETQTWEQLGITDDAMVVVETEKQEP
jgi:hypothetical protein